MQEESSSQNELFITSQATNAMNGHWSRTGHQAACGENTMLSYVAIYDNLSL